MMSLENTIDTVEQLTRKGGKYMRIIKHVKRRANEQPSTLLVEYVMTAILLTDADFGKCFQDANDDYR